MKMKFIYSTLIVVLFTTLLFGQVKLTNGEWPPYLSEKMKEGGVTSHIINESFKAEGIDVEYIWTPWKRAFEMAKNGQCDGSAVWSENAERRKDFYYSDPVLELKTAFFHRKDLNFSWKELKDLSKYSIGGATGYNYGDKFQKLEKEGILNVDRIPKDEMNAKKLYHKRIDLFPVQVRVGKSYLKNELTPEQAKEITMNETFLNIKTYHLIISKKSPRAKEYIEKFNAGLKKLKASGKFDKYMKNSEDGKY